MTAPNQKLLEYFFEDVHLDTIICWISPALLWDSTTVIMLVHLQYVFVEFFHQMQRKVMFAEDPGKYLIYLES